MANEPLLEALAAVKLLGFKLKGNEKFLRRLMTEEHS